MITILLGKSTIPFPKPSYALLLLMHKVLYLFRVAVVAEISARSSSYTKIADFFNQLLDPSVLYFYCNYPTFDGSITIEINSEIRWMYSVDLLQNVLIESECHEGTLLDQVFQLRMIDTVDTSLILCHDAGPQQAGYVPFFL